MLPSHPAYPQLHVLDLLGIGADEPEDAVRLEPPSVPGQNPRFPPGRKVVILCGLSSFVGDCSERNDCGQEDRQHQRPPAAAPHSWPRPRDITSQTRTLAAPEAAATADRNDRRTRVDDYVLCRLGRLVVFLLMTTTPSVSMVPPNPPPPPGGTGAARMNSPDGSAVIAYSL
jgi:hypothetical protein